MFGRKICLSGLPISSVLAEMTKFGRYLISKYGEIGYYLVIIHLVMSNPSKPDSTETLSVKINYL